jgi:hypothetical protein
MPYINLIYSSVADPDLGSETFCAFIMEKKSGSEMNIPDHISESLKLIICAFVSQPVPSQPFYENPQRAYRYFQLTVF